MKKILLIIAFLISGLGLSAQSTTINYGSYSLKFTVLNQEPAECEVVCSTLPTAETSIVIPSTVTIEGNEYSVTSIGEEAFVVKEYYDDGDDYDYDYEENPYITNVEIPSTVRYIGDYAFAYCTSLESVICYAEEVPDGYDIFYHCPSDMIIYVPAKSVELYEDSWYNRKIMSVYSLINTVIDYEGYSLKFTVTSLEPAECEVVCSTLPTAETSIVIPSAVTIGGNEYSVTSIGEEAFVVKEYYDEDYYYDYEENPYITSVEIPSTVRYIGDYAFAYCTSLESVICYAEEVPDGYDIFYHCPSDMIIYVPAKSVELYEDSWYNRKIMSVYSLINTVVDYEGYSLKFTVTNQEPAECEVVCSTLPTAETSIVIPSTVTIEGKEYNVTSIGEYAFAMSGGNDYYYDYEETPYITSVEIPSTVRYIGDYAFGYCTSLESVICYAEEVPMCDDDYYNIFRNCPSDMIIYVPYKSIELYKGSYPWRYYKVLSVYSLINTVVDYEGYSLKFTVLNQEPAECEVVCSTFPTTETSIVIPSTATIEGKEYKVTSIGEKAFVVKAYNEEYEYSDYKANPYITNVEIPSTVRYIGDYAFAYCTSLESIEIPSGVTELDGAFEGCVSLKNVVFGKDSQLTILDDFIFCKSLESIEIPAGVTSLGESFIYTNLSSMLCHAEDVPVWDFEDGWDVLKDMVIYVPEKSVELYKSAFPWAFFTIKAIPTHYEVSLSANPEEAGVLTGAGAYDVNGTVTVTAAANAGYKFLNWTEDGKVVSEENAYTFTITKDRDLIANFVSTNVSYNVTLIVIPIEAGSVTGSGYYSAGDKVVLKATANEGYKFASWIENGTVISNETEFSFTITDNKIIVANFEQMDYSVTASVNAANNGAVIGTGSYNHGDNVTLTAMPNVGYKFVNWTENNEVVSTELQYSFVVTSDRAFVANFELIEYYVSAAVNAAEAGEIIGDGKYYHGDTVAMTAKANEGYRFLNWTEKGEVVSEDANYMFVAFRDRELVANFVETEGVEELSASLNVYPNPASDRLFIETETEIKEVYVLDMYGRTQNLYASELQGFRASVEVSELNSGVYFVKVVTDNGEVVRRFIKK